MNNFSQETLKAMFAQETEQIFYLLLEIDPDTEGMEKVYVYNSQEYEKGEPRVINHDGNKYTACPFEINLPSQGMDVTTEVTLTIGNVDRALIDAIRSQTKPFLINMRVVMSDDLEKVEAGPWRMKLISCTANAITIEGTIITDRFMDSPFPKGKMDKTIFPLNG